MNISIMKTMSNQRVKLRKILMLSKTKKSLKIHIRKNKIEIKKGYQLRLH